LQTKLASDSGVSAGVNKPAKDDSISRVSRKNQTMLSGSSLCFLEAPGSLMFLLDGSD